MNSQIGSLSAYEKTSLDFRKIKGVSIPERYSPFYDYVKGRQQELNYPFARQFNRTFDNSHLVNINLPEIESMNYGSQDYLGLSTDNEVLDYAIQTVKTLGFHTAGSPVLVGRTQESKSIEIKISSLLKTECTLVFPTGWMACFAALAAHVTTQDYILLDEYAHNCLQVAAKFSTQNIKRVKHNSNVHIEELLKEIRAINSTSAIFIVVEGLYSMHSDSPQLNTIYDFAKKYQAIIVLDIAHDFGSLEQNGLGILNQLKDINLNELIVCGSFSKSFSSIGGFITGSKFIETQVSIHSNTYMFSNAIPQFQSAVINKCFDIIFSKTGESKRKDLFEKSIYVRTQLQNKGLKVLGIPSAIIPIEINSLMKARFMSKIFEENGIILNLVEFPAVPRQIGLFRLQISSNYDYSFLNKAINLIIKANEYANNYLNSIDNIEI